MAHSNILLDLFHFDPLAQVMLFLICFIGACIASFASRYLQGDRLKGQFFAVLVFLLISVGVMVCSDHIALFFGSWCLSNLFLVKLMIHKSSWKAAKNSGILALKNYILGALCVGLGLLLLYHVTGEVSIRALIHKPMETNLILPALLLLVLGAMTQSAIWPFHKWLISSLNSPTPVSAIMHAGLVNGGGFLLARFAPLYFTHTDLLTLIFVVGITTSLIGTLWKLIQNDIKRMLACSTMGQMGFMLAQCGLGFFPAAIAHLVSHGMFKAYLFLASGAAAQEKRHDLNYPPTLLVFSQALLSALLGTYCFSLVSGKSLLKMDTTLVLVVIVFLALAQAAIPLLSRKGPFKLPIAIILTSAMGLVYGSVMSLIAKILAPMELLGPQPLNGFHIAGISLLIVSWLSILILKNNSKIRTVQPWMLKGYVAALNASQPHPKTVTPHRNQYKYL